MRGFSSDSPSTNRKYITYKYDHLPDDFEDLIEYVAKLTIPHKKAAEKLDNILTNASLYAEIRCRKMRRPPLPKPILILRDKYNFYRRCLSEFRLGKTILEPNQPDTPKWPAEKPSSKEECSTLLRSTKRKLRDIEKSIHTSMDDQIYSSIAECVRTGDKKLETIIWNQRKARETKAMFSKLNRMCKNISRSSLDSIQVPTDLPNQPKLAKQWKTIDVPTEITQYLIRRNRTHFGQADGTPFTRAPLSIELTYQGSSTTAELILEGEYDSDELDNISSLFLSHMQRVTKLDSVRSHVTDTDFKSKIKSWKESTSTSPSGLHLGHYHALVKNHDLNENHDDFAELERRRNILIRAHVTLINYAVKFGYSFDRWKKIVNVMILKEPGDTRIHRLRVIHIYEADYNMINSIFWRRTIHHCEDNHLLHQGQFGGRPGKSSHDPVFIEELINEFSRATRRSNIKFANNAASCYDRILINLASIFSRKYGCPKTVCLVMASNLQDAKYHLKTGLNVTEESYQHSALYPIHGSGQGSGNSPAIWTFISCSLFDMHSEICHGSKFKSYDNNTTLRIHMIGFVDDSTGYCLAQPSESYISLLNKMQHDAQQWSDLLQTSGGKLEFQKCLYHLTHYEFLKSGEPILLPKCKSSNNSIRLHNNSRTNTTSIPLKSNYDDHKTLGYWKSPSGNQNSQISQLLHRSNSHARIVQSTPLNRREAWTYYFSIYLPSCSYPLPASHISEPNLDKIQRVATRAILSKCGYNRNYPRAVVFGPTSYGGLSFRHLYVEQGIQQILLFLRHWRAQSLIGQLLKIVMSWIQFQSGIGNSILSDTSLELPHLESKWISSLRLALHEFNAFIELDDPQIPPLQRDKDSYLMDHVIASNKFTPSDIKRINYCRLYLQAITISDISNIQGTQLDPAFLIGNRLPTSSFNNSQPVKQEKPDQTSWTKWKEACRLFSNAEGYLDIQLGSWCLNAIELRRTWFSYISSDTKFMLVRSQDSFEKYTILQGTQIYVPSPESDLIQYPNQNYYPAACQAHTQGWKLLQTLPVRHEPPPAPRPTRFSDHFIDQPWKYHLLSGIKFLTSLREIRQTITLNNLILCSDGSVLHSQGSFGWVLSKRDGTRLASNSGPAFGCDPGDSFRAEAYGVLSWMIFFHEFTTRHNIRIPTDTEISNQTHPYITAYTDNEGVLRRIQTQLAWKYLSPANTLLPDWDIINQICYTMANLLPPVTLSHVKGHQDNEVQYHNLPLKAQLNIEADHLVGQYQQRNLNYDRSKVPQLPTNPAQLHLNSRTITSKYPKALRFHRGMAPLKTYLMDRNSWTEEAYDNINWESFTRAIRKTTVPPQFINKFIHRHLPVGSRVKMYDKHEDEVCPFCKDSIETQSHLFSCQHQDLCQLRCLLYQRMRKKCDDLHTDPVLCDSLINGIEQFLEQTPIEPIAYDPSHPSQTQDNIGWYNLLQGRFHKGWAKAYKKHLPAEVNPKQKLTGARWTTSIILIIWQWSYEYWDARNTLRVGKDNEIFHAKEKEKAAREVRFLYNLKYKICANDRDILTIPLDEQLESSTTSINNWVTLWRPVLLRSVSRAITKAITNVRSIKEFFKPKQ